MIDPRHPDYTLTPVHPSRPRYAYAPARESKDPGGHGPGQNGTASSVLAKGPAVTIVTPYYNTGRVFRETVACVLNQSLQNFEWLIVNDGSADAEALAVLNEVRGIDPRVRVIDHAKNQGLPASRNTGWRQAQAALVFFLDSDDLIEPTAIEKSALHLHCNPHAAFVHGLTVGFGAQEYLWDKGFHDREAFLKENLVTATAMIRTAVLEDVGGFDASIRGGLEDWDFWLRCAAKGHWGETVPEYWDWYRRRANQHAAWENLASRQKQEAFITAFKAKNPHLVDRGFPACHRPWHMPYASVPETVGMHNPLAKKAKRLLLIVPWLRLGGADRFNLDMTRTLAREQGFEITIATTLGGHPWLPEFTAVTPDVFLLDHLGNRTEYPRLLRYLCESRRPDYVMISNSELGYTLLPFLRSVYPEGTYLDYCHMEEEHWHNGGHPRSAAAYQTQIDMSVVSSEHLRGWMGRRGADKERIRVCTTNVDTSVNTPDSAARVRWRRELNIDAKTPILLYAARLCDQKRPLMMARALKALAEGRGAPGADAKNAPLNKGPEFVAVVAGDGELSGQLGAYLDQHGLRDRIRMIGPIAGSKMPGLLAASDVLFLPSRWEGIALSIFEAMSVGLAIVASDVGGQRELVTPDCGVLLPLGDERTDPDGEQEVLAYARALHRVLVEPGRMRDLGAAARARVYQHYQLSAMGRRMVEIAREADGLKQSHPRQVVESRLALELALQAVEMARVHDLAEYLWPYRDRCLQRDQQEAEQRAHREAARASARQQVDQIEQTRSFRLLQSAKRTLVYRLLARARYGRDWEASIPREDPEARLNYLRQMRSLKVITTIKSVPPVSVLSRSKRTTQSGARGSKSSG